MLPTIFMLTLSLLPAHWSGTLPTAGLTSLRIDNPLGKVTVIAAEDGIISAEAEVTGYDAIKDTPWFKSAKIELTADGKRGLLKLDIDNQFSLTDPPHINFTVKVPKDLVCNINAVLDDIVIKGTEVAYTASLVNGNISITAPRTLGSYECVNGSITIDATEPLTSGMLIARAVDGDVNIHLPKGSLATYDTDTINGTITLPATATASVATEKKASIVAQTINGNINIVEVEPLR
jgi:hypothetical protein